MNYITEVSNLFFSHSQDVKILSPADYAIIAEWEKQEIPLTVVLDSINRSFDNLTQNNECSKVESIEYFHSEVKKNFADWLQNQKDVG